jgi:hypothetical protein
LAGRKRFLKVRRALSVILTSDVERYSLAGLRYAMLSRRAGEPATSGAAHLDP